MTDTEQRLQQTLDAFAPEDLDPELAAYLHTNDEGWDNIQHPLVYSIMHAAPMNRMVNKSLREKKRALREAQREGEWSSYCWLHERPYRIDAFIDIEGELSDEDYWHLLGELWIDSENIRQSPRIWQRLLSNTKRGDRQMIMTEDEREALLQLSTTLTVYQGHTDEHHDGMSFTTKRDTAVWFAQRFARLEGTNPVITTGKVAKADVIAYFTRRGESEIVVGRSKVKDTRTRSV